MPLKLVSFTAALLLFTTATAQSKGQADLDKAILSLENYEMSDAKKFAESALKKDAALADAYYVLGMVKSEENYMNGLADFNKAIELETKIADAWESRANIISSSPDADGVINFESAIKDYDIAISMEPDNWGYLFNRAGTYNAMGKFELSTADLNKAMNMEEADADMILTLRADNYLQLGNFKQALEDINQSVASGMTDGYAYIIRSDIYLAMGETIKACEDLKTASKFEEILPEYLEEKMKAACN